MKGFDRGKGLVSVAIIMTLLSFSAAGQEDVNPEQELEEIRSIVVEMNESGIPTQRVEDLYSQANSTYNTQLARNESGKETDYSGISEALEQVEDIRTKGFRTKDQIELLRSRIEELDKNQDLNLSAAKSQLEDAEVEFRDERFERAQEHIDNGYEEISEAQSAVTQAQAFAEATQDNLRNFVEENWKILSAVSGSSIIIIYIVYKEYLILRLKKRRKKLKRKRDVLQDLIAESQDKYFQKNDLSESAYNTRTDRYGEMIRDINRQLPLIEEELEKRNSLSLLIREKFLEGEEAE